MHFWAALVYIRALHNYGELKAGGTLMYLLQSPLPFLAA